jgi:hypothetical protein
MDIDKQRIAAVRTLEALGYGYSGRAVGATGRGAVAVAVTDDCRGRRPAGTLMRRADALTGCTEGAAEAAELKTIVDVLEAYEAKRWPDSKEPGGKG